MQKRDMAGMPHGIGWSMMVTTSRNCYHVTLKNACGTESRPDIDIRLWVVKPYAKETAFNKRLHFIWSPFPLVRFPKNDHQEAVKTPMAGLLNFVQ
jgi:hypothetical protein